MDGTLTLRKAERLCSKKLLDELFAGTGSQSLVAFPLRAVFRPTEEAGAQMLVSVPKRHFKRAVKRNRVKRQVREAYRKHKHLLAEKTACRGVAIAFLWLDGRLHGTPKVENRVESLLLRISERL